MSRSDVFKFLQGSVDGKHLMHLQSETSVFKFLHCNVDRAFSVYSLLKNNYKRTCKCVLRFLPPQSSGSLSQSVVLFDIRTRKSVILRPVASHATLNCTAMFTFGFNTLVGFVDSSFSFTDQQKKIRNNVSNLTKSFAYTLLLLLLL